MAELTSRPSSAREKGESEAVAVGIRVRPLLPRDLAEGSRECIRKVPNEPQLVLGVDRAFTFDHVFESTSSQEQVHAECMSSLVQSVAKGLNATVLAYGQTGSGKTHTMGSSAQSAEDALEGIGGELSTFGTSVGVIPRMLQELFLAVSSIPGAKCTAKASFIEIYKEEVFDLLSWTTESSQLATLPIREENGAVSLSGLRQRKVSSVAEAMTVLSEGARSRSTGATAMNATSSRSHAIFTLALELLCGGKKFYPKLNFVDLAGSERAKRTGASGDRLQEGIQINKGLLALGNVINALCERHSHVPYRDSKLTRLLQDSLGGNSRTLMLACVSPADADLEETLNTLKYANRARQIRNKPIVVQDSLQAQIAELQEQILKLEARLAHYEGGGSLNVMGKDAAPPAGSNPSSGLLKRLSQLESENEGLRKRLTSLVQGGAAQAGEVKGEKMQSALVLSPESVDKPSTAEEEALAQEQLEEEMEFHRLQGDLSEQLQGLDESLALKQALLKSQEGDKQEVAALQSQLNQLEAELQGVSSERQRLLSQVEALQKKKASQEEEDRAAKKLEAVEAELIRLRAQQSKQAALLRSRQASERRVKELEAEIENIKANKVALARRQREEAELHRLQRKQRESELLSLKRKEEKTSLQLHRLEDEHARQAAVLKRKSEEIAAQQKRIRLAEGGGGGKGRVGAPRIGGRVPPKVEGKREEEMSKEMDKMVSRPRDWLAEEIDAVMVVKELHAQIQTQIAQRRAAQLKLNALEEHNSQADKEMASLQAMASSDKEVGMVCSEASATRQAEVEALRAKVDYHNTELTKLQGRLIRCDTDEKKTLGKIDALTNIKHSKAVLKHALPQLVAMRVSARRSEQILAVKASAMKTQGELIVALQKEVEKQRKQGAAEQLQLMEQLQQLQQALENERAHGGKAASPSEEKDTAARLEMRLQALKRAASGPSESSGGIGEGEEGRGGEESEESEEESEVESEEGSEEDEDWIRSEEAKSLLTRGAMKSLAEVEGGGEGDVPLPLRKGRRSVVCAEYGVEGSRPQEKREEVKEERSKPRDTGDLGKGGGEKGEVGKVGGVKGEVGKGGGRPREKGELVRPGSVPIARVDLSKRDERRPLASLDSNSKPDRANASKRKLFDPSATLKRQ